MTCAVLIAGLLVGADAAPENRASVVVVVGAGGTQEYQREFSKWGENWRRGARTGRARFHTINLGAPQEKGPAVETTDRQRLKTRLAIEAKAEEGECWLVLIGHGTFDGRAARFNLRGPDVTAAELSKWVGGFKRPLAVLTCFSSSAPFINRLSVPGRVIVSATRSGAERNFSRFGAALSESIIDPRADLDKDGQTSLLEAWLRAAHETEAFYKRSGRLATEHALLDDNGDGRGSQSDLFRGVRLIASGAGPVADGIRAHQFHLIRSPEEQQFSAELRARRNQLELQVLQLRGQKGDLAEADYLDRQEELLLQLALLYEQAGRDRQVIQVGGEKP